DPVSLCIFAPLFSLSLLLFTGLYLSASPYGSRRRAWRGATWGASRMGHGRGQVSDSYGLTTLDALSGGDSDEDGHGPIANTGPMAQRIGHVGIAEDLVLQPDVAAPVAAHILVD